MLIRKKILIILLMLIFFLLPATTKRASESATITSIQIMAPESGIYEEGQKITLKMDFDKPVKGEMPVLKITFGDENVREISVPDVEQEVNYIEYIYTITSGDNGKLEFQGITNKELVDSNNNKLNISFPDYKFKGNEILAETTIARGNLENIEFEWHEENVTNNSLSLKAKNITTLENYRYYVHFSHNKNENLSVVNKKSITDNNDIWTSELVPEKDNLISRTDRIVEENGDIYIWICEIDDKYGIPKILVNGKKIERKELLPLSKRIIGYFSFNGTTTFCWETIEDKTKRKINIKIGEISDMSILKSIENNQTIGLKKLLEYSKTAEIIYSGTIALGNDATVTKNLDIINDKYYFVYFELDDENGKYYPIEDISLYQCNVSEKGEKNLNDFLSNKFNWYTETKQEELSKENTFTTDTESNKENTEDNTISQNKIPYAGRSIIIISIVLASILIGAYAYKRNKDLKGI